MVKKGEGGGFGSPQSSPVPAPLNSKPKKHVISNIFST